MCLFIGVGSFFIAGSGCAYFKFWLANLLVLSLCDSLAGFCVDKGRAKWLKQKHKKNYTDSVKSTIPDAKELFS